MAREQCVQCKQWTDSSSNFNGGMYKGHYFCSQSCRKYWVKEHGGGGGSDHPRSSGGKLLSGLGNIGTGIAQQDMNDLFSGTGKIALGLGGLAFGAVKGLGGLAIKGAKGAAKLASESGKKVDEVDEIDGVDEEVVAKIDTGAKKTKTTKVSSKKQLREKYEPEIEGEVAEAILQEIQTVTFEGDTSQIANSLLNLIPMLSSQSDNLRKSAEAKFEFGMFQLRNMGDNTTADFLQKQFDGTDCGKAKARAAKRKEANDARRAKEKAEVEAKKARQDAIKAQVFGTLGGLFGKKK